MDAELIYLFRHQVMRDALYQLLLPSERAALHVVALDSYDATEDNLRTARELVLHAQLALSDGHGLGNDRVQEIRSAQLSLLRRWASHAGRAWQNEEEAVAQRSVATHPLASRTEAAEAYLQAAKALVNAGRTLEALADLKACREASAEAPVQSMVVSERVTTAQCLASIGDAPGAEVAALEAVATAEVLAEPQLLARALQALGSLTERLGRLEEALALNQRAFGLVRDSGNAEAIAASSNGYASVLRELGRMDEALAVSEHALQCARATGIAKLIAGALIGIGISLRGAGRYGEAEAYYLECMEICAQRGLRRGHAVCMGNLGNIYSLNHGDYGRAEPLFVQAIAVHREDGAINSEAIAWNNLATVWLAVGRVSAAAHGFTISMELSSRGGYPLLESRAACNFAECAALLGRPGEAREAADRGLACLQGRDRGKFQLEFGEMTDLQVRLAQPGCEDPAGISAAALARMNRLAQELGQQAEGFARAPLERVSAVAQECREAARQGRAPLLVGGRLPQSLSPEQCAALLSMPWVTDQALREVLAARAGDQPTPNWQDESPASV